MIVIRVTRQLENTVRGTLIVFGLKIGKAGPTDFAGRVGELMLGDVVLESALGPVLHVHATLKEQSAAHDRLVLDAVRLDPLRRLLMTVPDVGTIVERRYRTAVDIPQRFVKSSLVPVHFGRTPTKYVSGQTDRTGGISKCGDAEVRSLLFEGAITLLTRMQRWSWLKRWGVEVAKRRGLKRACVAVARKLAIILHRIWVDATEFRWSREAVAA